MEQLIERSQLVKGTKYYLTIPAEHIAIYEGSDVHNIYFTPIEQHPYHVADIEGWEGMVSFINSDDFDGFIEVN